MYTTVSPYVMGNATNGSVVVVGANGATAPPEHMNHIAMGIWIGGYLALKSAAYLLDRGVRTVVNTAIEFITETPEAVNWEDLHRNGVTVHNTYWDDTLAQPIFPTTSLEGAVKKIDEVVQSGGQVLVNCAMGKSRSASCVIAYLMARQGMGYDQALTLIKRSRPQCQPNPNFERQLRQLEASLRSTYPITASHAHNLSAIDNSTSPQGHRYASPAPRSMGNASSPLGSQLLSVSPSHATITRPVSPTFALGNDNLGTANPASPRYSSFSSPATVGTAAATAGHSAHNRHSHHSPFHNLKSYFSHPGSSGAGGHGGHGQGGHGGHGGHIGTSGTVSASSPVALGHNDVHGLHRAASLSGASLGGYGGSLSTHTNSPHHGYGQSSAPNYSRVGGGSSSQAWRPYGPTSSNQLYSPHTPQPYRVGNGMGMGGYYDVNGMGRRLSL